MEKGICEICGKEFNKVNIVQKYCSAKCRNIAKGRARRIKRYNAPINNNFASVELIKEDQYMDQFKCNRKNCQLYCENNLYFENNCMALQDVDKNYILNCPFYKHK